MRAGELRCWDFRRGTLQVAAALPCPIPERLARRIVATAIGAADIKPPRVPVVVKFVTRTNKELQSLDKHVGKAPPGCKSQACWGYQGHGSKITSYVITVKLHSRRRMRRRHGIGQALTSAISSVAHELQHIHDHETGVPMGRPSAYGNTWEFNATEREHATMALIARSKPWRKYFDRLERQLQRAVREK
jgi:hypothetical protein